MKGDFSRQTFDRRKHYSSVLMQQGRVQVDADWNEQQAIHQYRYETQADDVIGPCGAPKPEYKSGFKIEVTPDGLDLKISKGHIYVDGILCENDREDATLKQQDDLPMKKGNFAGGFTLPTAARRYLVYLDVWQRHITAIDDAGIRETALGGPDTATRAKTIWQVKLYPVENTIECSTLGSSWKPDAVGSGTLNVHTASANQDTGPCVLPPVAGFRRLENQLYRVEIHTGTDPNNPGRMPTFKWSRDNGSVVTSITKISGQTIVVQDTGRDEILGFARDQWVEVLDDRMELSDQRGQLVQISSVNPATREIIIKSTTPLPPIDEAQILNDGTLIRKLHLKIRRWDQTGATATSDGVAIKNGWIQLEDGIEVQFSSGTYRTGDYWLIPARTAINFETGSIEWQFDPVTKQPVPQLPHGIQHHYCPLALIDFDGSKFISVPNSDCRRLFPSLTDITARDIRFDNGICNMLNAKTVQDALNTLCQRHEDVCTITALPGVGWEAIFNKIADGQDAKICFQIGTYLLDNPIILKNKGHLKISGCGVGTRIIASRAESVFRFETCKSVVIKDLYAESGITGSGANQLIYLNGALTFCGCTKVDIEGVELKCAAGAEKAASCINVRDTVEYSRSASGNSIQITPVSSIYIRNSDLHVGHQQVGILLINVLRANIENNIIQVDEKPANLSLPVLLQNKKYLSAVRSLMIPAPKLGKPDTGTPSSGVDTAIISAGKGSVWFKTDPSLVKAWQEWTNFASLKGVQKDRDLLFHLMNTADRALLNRGVIRVGDQVFDRFKNWYDKLNDESPAVGSQGIVIGGRIAKEIHILNNKVLGVRQGIHIGVSHRGTTPQTHDTAGMVHIIGNSIRVLLTPGINERHGIFVGNCDSLIVQNNYSDVQRFSNTLAMPIEGIRIHGYLGRMMIVRQNHLVNTTVGIRVVSVGTVSGKPQWVVTDNVAPNSKNAVLAPPSVRGLADNYA